MGDGKCSVCNADWSSGWDAYAKSSGDLLFAAAAHQKGVDKEDIKQFVLALDEMTTSDNTWESLAALIGAKGKVKCKNCDACQGMLHKMIQKDQYAVSLLKNINILTQLLINICSATRPT